MKNFIKNMALFGSIISTSALFNTVELRPVFYEKPWLCFAIMFAFAVIYIVCELEV